MPTVKNRKPGRPADDAVRIRREEEILDAAATLFAQRGFSDANTQVLAEMLQVGKGTIYRYFPTKRDLFLAAVDRAMHRAKAEIDRHLEGIEDPLERLAAATSAYLAFFGEHPEHVELIMQERAQFKDRKKPTYFMHQDAHVEPWRDSFRSLIAAGRVRNIPVERITDVLSDLLYGAMFTNYFIGRRRPPEDQAADLMDIAFCGILSESERSQWILAKRGQSPDNSGPSPVYEPITAGGQSPFCDDPQGRGDDVPRK